MSSRVPILDASGRLPARFVPAATQQQAGGVRIATPAEAAAGAAADVAVSPAGARALAEAAAARVSPGDPGEARGHRDDYGRPAIDWAGLRWVARDDSWRSGGPNASDSWAAGNVSVTDRGELRLALTNPGGRPVGAELVSVASFGYGTYDAVFRADFASWDRYAVLGLFTFDWSAGAQPGYTELDMIEVSRWGQDQISGKFTYYPSNDGVHAPDYSWLLGLQRARVRMVWAPGRVTWTLRDAESGALLYTATQTENVPTPRNEQVHLNLWAFNAPGWQNASPAEAFLEHFAYSPVEVETSNSGGGGAGGLRATVDPQNPRVLRVSESSTGVRVDPQNPRILRIGA